MIESGLNSFPHKLLDQDDRWLACKLPATTNDTLHRLEQLRKWCDTDEFEREWYQGAWFSIDRGIANGLATDDDKVKFATEHASELVPWSCGTTACLAGKTCLDAGDRPLVVVSDHVVVYESERVQTLDGERYLVDFRARLLLGLPESLSMCLFQGDNDRDAVVHMLDTLVEAQRRVLDYFARRAAIAAYA